MRDLYPKCGTCQVFGYCTQTEEECIAYHEGFGWTSKKNPEPDCGICEVNGYCTQTATECQAYGDFTGMGQVIFSDDSVSSGKGLPANLGLMNWFTGTITSISTGEHMALVTVKYDQSFITSMLPLQSFLEMGYQIGDTVSVAVKALNVKLMR